MKTILATAAIALGLAGAGTASAAMPNLGAGETARTDKAGELTLVAGGCGPYAYRNYYGYCTPYGGAYYAPPPPPRRHYYYNPYGYHHAYPAYRPHYPVVPVIVPRFNFWFRF